MYIGLIAATMYCITALLMGMRLFHQKGPSFAVLWGFAAIALSAHLILLSQSILLEPGQNMSISNVASLVAWLISISMTVGSLAFRNIFLLPVVFGFSTLIILFSLFIPDTHIMHIELKPALISHITLALFAYGCLTIAFLYALQLAYINYRLKHKQASLIDSPLPPLMVVESILFKILLTGTLLLTLSLITGFMFLDNMFVQEQAHKTVFSIIAWVIFCVVLVGHRKWGWRGRPVISATIVGTVFLTIAYFGSRFVKEVLIN
ncbi:cytochrome c biogenesis protein CcsA [Aestuariibacter sp. AA17]|uniref:Cytochrome c biogenesis protein CcsA n=1 Tax=Fluctibacter corallii TaxID=2984329 RepID=A0ABT3ABC6_9ALTE|nr:cytochrome c biogenesis protein CcsA [Aestuariibacter sp. AA17]MCV2885592.1 cytochrome c biogenesis protein CcsA [Aestuariibacter sp. AA17]